MSRKRALPLVVRRGSTEVKIYRATDSFPYHRVCYYTGGKRQVQTFADLKEAREEAEIQAAKLSRGDGLAAMMTSRDRVIYIDAKTHVDPLGVRIDAAAKEYAEAKRELPEMQLREAVEFYRKFYPKDVEPRMVSTVIEELIAQRKKDDCSHAYIRDLRLRLQRFSKTFNCPINSLTPSAVSGFLEGLNVGSRHQNNYRRVIQTLLRFAQQQGYLPEEVDMMKRVRRRKETDEEVEIFSPVEFAAMLGAASTNLLPVLVFGGLCGLRNAEIRRLQWADVKWEEGYVEIKKGTAKTRARRTAPMSANAVAWLSEYTEAIGGVWPNSESVLNRAFRDLAKDCKIDEGWKHNGLRHSFCSYRAALTKNYNVTAFEAGNSPAMIQRHYWKTVSEREARQWFDIMPEEAENVVQVGAAANG